MANRILFSVTPYEIHCQYNDSLTKVVSVFQPIMEFFECQDKLEMVFWNCNATFSANLTILDTKNGVHFTSVPNFENSKMSKLKRNTATSLHSTLFSAVNANLYFELKLNLQLFYIPLSKNAHFGNHKPKHKYHKLHHKITCSTTVDSAFNFKNSAFKNPRPISKKLALSATKKMYFSRKVRPLR